MEQALPLVSIVVPVFMVGDLVRTCAGSILGQDFSDFELILVDDGSPDNSGHICDEIASRDHRVKVIHKQNGNSATARNAGLDIARGEYVVFVDADDRLCPGALRTMVEKGIEEKADLAVFSHRTIGRETVESRLPVQSEVSWNEAVRDLLRYRFPTSPWAKLFRRTLFSQIRFDFRAKMGQDLVCNLDVLLSRPGRIVYHPDVVYDYVLRRGSAVHRNDFVRRYDVISSLVRERLEQCGLFSEFASDYALFRATNQIQANLKSGTIPGRERVRSIFFSASLNPKQLNVYQQRIIQGYRTGFLFGSVCFAGKILRHKIGMLVRPPFARLQPTTEPTEGTVS